MRRAREHSRLVIWPRRPLAGPQGPIYRYAVVGMICTDTPIEGLEGQNEITIDGRTTLRVPLQRAPKRATQHRKEASDLLRQLSELETNEEGVKR